MARKTPYTFSLALIDIILLILTGGLWVFVILVREMLKRS